MYKFSNRADNFSDRLTLFLLHFSFFLKNFKNEENKIILQEIYDFNFRQLELSIREIGYGDQSINKKMKDYINVFHGIISEIHYWDDMKFDKKIDCLLTFLQNFQNTEYLVDYFEVFNEDLLLNSSLLSSENLFMLSTNNEAKPVQRINQTDTPKELEILLVTITAPA